MQPSGADCPECGMTMSCPKGQQDCPMMQGMTMAEQIDWAKVLGELMADHELKMTESAKRAAVLPPELAEQVAAAIRLLHETPPPADK